MSKLVATIHAYDALTTVRWTVTVRDYHKGTGPKSEVVFHAVGVFPSTGKQEPNEWFRDLLLQMAART